MATPRPKGSVGPALVPGPGQVSNRTILRRLEAWGCGIVRTENEWVTVDVRGTMIKVRSGHTKTINPAPVITAMLKALDLTWEQFLLADLDSGAWRGANASVRRQRGQAVSPDVTPEDFPESLLEKAHQEALDEDARRARAHRAARTRAKHERTEHLEAPALDVETAEQLKQRLNPPNAQPPVEREPEREEPVMPAEVHPIRQHSGGRPPRGVIPKTTQALDYLVKAARPVSNHELAEAMDWTVAEANAALAGLAANSKSAIRVKQGVYRATDIHLQDVRLHAQMETQQRVQQVVEAVTAVAANEAPVDDEVINDVLDLLFPNGFKARHLARIDSWREETKRLIQEVQA